MFLIIVSVSETHSFQESQWPFFDCMLGCILIVAAVSQNRVCTTSPCLRLKNVFVIKDVDLDCKFVMIIGDHIISLNQMVLKRIMLKLGYQSTSRWCRLQCRRESVCSSLCPVGFVLSENQLLVSCFNIINLIMSTWFMIQCQNSLAHLHPLLFQPKKKQIFIFLYIFKL